MQCDYFDSARCRSCTLMGQPYAVELAAKQAHCERVVGSVAPGVRWLEPMSSPESHFRNKAKLVVGGEAGAVTVGILDAAGRGVDLRECGLYEPGLADVLPAIASFVDETGIEPYDVPGRRGELKHVLVTHSPDDELMIRFVLRSRRHEALLRSRLARLRAVLPNAAVVSLNILPEHRAALEGDVEYVLTERALLPMRMGDVVLGLRPNSFFQTNTRVAAGLYRQAQQWISRLDPAVVWDLYCGVGGFALHAAAGAPDRRVLGVEVSADAIASARLSAARLRQQRDDVGELAFEVGDATVTRATQHPVPEVVVVNPPRRGIGRLAAWLEQSAVPHVVYSSCNVDSLARDLAAMPSFDAERARLFDMFPQTSHHEVMVLLTRRGTGRLRPRG